MAMQEVLPGVLTAEEIIRDHYRELGARGGAKKTPAKLAACRLSIQAATACRVWKHANERLQRARCDVSAKPPRMTAKQYENEMARFEKALNKYRAFLKTRERGTL